MASTVLALAFTFSCSSDESDGGRENTCTNELFGCPYGGLQSSPSQKSSSSANINNINYGSQPLLNAGNAQYSATGNPPASNWAANETFSVNMDNTIIAGDSALVTITSSRELEELYVQFGGNTGYYTMELNEDNLVSSDENGNYIYSLSLQMESNLRNGDMSVGFNGGTPSSDVSQTATTTVSTLQNTNNNNYSNQPLMENAQYTPTGNPPATANWTGTFTVNIGSTIISGGSAIATITSSRQLSVLYIQLGGNNGYYTVTLNDGHLVSSSGGVYTYSVTLQFNQSILSGAFSISIRGAANSSTVSSPVAKNVETRRVGTGALQISLSWDKAVDLDLHVKPSWGNEIYFARKVVGNGQLDLDMICRLGNENVFFTTPLVDGNYTVYVNLYSKCGVTTPTKYVVSAYANGEILDFSEENQQGTFASSTNNGTKRTIGCINVAEGVISPIVCGSTPSSSSLSRSSSSVAVPSSSSIVTVQIGGIWNTADEKRFTLDGNEWSYSQEGVFLSRGTWANGTSGKIVLTAQQYYSGDNWLDIPALLQQYKTNTVSLSVNATGTQMIISGSTAPALAAPIWGQIEGTYTRQNSTPSSSSRAASSSSVATSTPSSSSVNIVYGELYDERNRQTYTTVVIGEQTWMAKNLNYAMDGSKCYSNAPANCEQYGRLYDYETAMYACPDDWHLPSDEEWGALMQYVNPSCSLTGDCAAGYRLRTKGEWKSNGIPNLNELNEFGFSALPGGYLNDSFGGLGSYGAWWSDTETDDYSNAYYRYMDYFCSNAIGGCTGSNVFRVSGNKMDFHSVRCVKD